MGLSRTRRRALVVLRADASSSDVLAAYVHGYMLLHSSTPMVPPSMQVRMPTSEQMKGQPAHGAAVIDCVAAVHVAA